MDPATRDRKRLNEAHRIVVKLGTAVVTRDGVELALGRLYGIVEDIARLHRSGRQIVLVSSGAVGMGMRVLGLDRRPASLGLRQACAAVGQGQLIGLYTQAFAQLGVTAAQVLLTQEDLGDRDRALCLRTTLMRLLELGTLPILNENDSVSVRELVEYRRTASSQETDELAAFGDNDALSAHVALALDAEALVLMTDVPGLLTDDPRTNPDAERVRELVGVQPSTLALAGRSAETGMGTGGMTSKLEAAKLVTEAGLTALIVDGTAPHGVSRVLRGEDVGTVIWPHAHRPTRRHQIAVRADRRGALVLNEGALGALLHRKASLLPIGVVAVEGEFSRGEVVELRDPSGRIHGRGLVNYDATACRALAGHHSSEMPRILGYRGYDALVTRDNLVLVPDAQRSATRDPAPQIEGEEG
jgi:glutamate 5-kinase